MRPGRIEKLRTRCNDAEISCCKQNGTYLSESTLRRRLARATQAGGGMAEDRRVAMERATLESNEKLREGFFKDQCCKSALKSQRDNYINEVLSDAISAYKIRRKESKCDKKVRFTRKNKACNEPLPSHASVMQQFQAGEGGMVFPANIRFDRACKEVDKDCVNREYNRYIADAVNKIGDYSYTSDEIKGAVPKQR